jgi:hypothetical protein
VDRNVYPEAEFPAGQWDYQLFYQENFDQARMVFEANGRNTASIMASATSVASGRGTVS